MARLSMQDVVIFPRSQATKLHNDNIVITAADRRQMYGCYVVAHSLLMKHDVKCRVYDLGWGVEGIPLRAKLRDMGCEIVSWEGEGCNGKGPGWQTLLKPFLIDHALKHQEYCLWLDADTFVNKWIHEPFDSHERFLTNHGNFKCLFQNKWEVLDRLGFTAVNRPNQSNRINAGVIGFQRRDSLLREWKELCGKLINEPDTRSAFGGWDQGALEYLLIDKNNIKFEDGLAWNHILTDTRPKTPQQLIDQVATNPARILHFGGTARKPFHYWCTKRMLAWPNPLEHRRIAPDRSRLLTARVNGLSYKVEPDRVRERIRSPQRVSLDPQKWVYGVTTCPRKEPTLAVTLKSLGNAGIQPRIFDDHDKSLGGWGNWLRGLYELTIRNPNAEWYWMFQDDIQVNANFIERVVASNPPHDAAMVSYYLPSRWTSGKQWEAKRPELVGMLALMIRADAAKRLVVNPIQPNRRSRFDVMLGEWLRKMGFSWYYHSPSLVEHTGMTSTIYGEYLSTVQNNRMSSTFKSEEKQVGLVGYSCATGLGYLNQDIAKHCSIDRWLLKDNKHMPLIDRPVKDILYYRDKHEDSFIEGLDTIVFSETPMMSESQLKRAKKSGTRVVCIAMHEWLTPQYKWFNLVDTFICPTQHCVDQLRNMVGRNQNLEYLKWPVDIERFKYRPRTKCNRFVYVAGLHGYRDRKGTDIMLDAMKIAGKKVDLIVYQQKDKDLSWPKHVEVRTALDNFQMYEDGDVCVLPSRWEGLGLPMLECQSAGLPLITSNGPPMNEHNPWKVIGGANMSRYTCRTIPTWECDPAKLAQVMIESVDADITLPSASARLFAEKRSWEVQSQKLSKILRTAQAQEST